jgi:TrmH family RNA methyltransferase
MIVSRSNERLKALRRLHERPGRDASGRFAVEGEDLVREALAADVRIELVLWDAERPDAALRAALDAAGVESVAVASDVLAASSTLAHPARCIAVVVRDALPRLEPGSAAAQVGLRLHGVADPGNIGTLLRAAAALGPAHVALGPGCADPLSPKAVRASMGALFRVPLTSLDDAPAARRVALDGRADTPLWDVPLDLPVAFELGGERQGLPQAVSAGADVVARIPQEDAAESLNVAMAGTLALYELRRRRMTT